MKKKLLLLPLLLLCGCSTNGVSSSSNISSSSVVEKLDYTLYSSKGDETYKYWFYVDYNSGGKLVIARKGVNDESYTEYKSFKFGKYECLYEYGDYQGYDYVYDYGEYAIWYVKGK